MLLASVRGVLSRGMTFNWCAKIQKTSFVTLVISRHHTRYGRDCCMSRMNSKGLDDSSGCGSLRYDSIVCARDAS